jgi:hypothetical protein
MGRSKIGGRREPDKVERLTAQVAELTARLEALEGSPRASENGNGNGHDKLPQSRRDLLKLAGAAAAGAAGSIVLGAIPAAATQSQPLVMGATNNDASTTTQIFPTPSSPAPAPLFEATGQGITVPTTVLPTPSANSPTSQTIPLIGAIGPGGGLPTIAGVTDYPGYAPIQGVGGLTYSATGAKPNSEGVNGYGSGSIGIGVTGESDAGYGIVGGSGGIDIAALGNGRVLQLSLPGGPPPSLNWLANSPAGPPTYTPNDFEQVRDGNGVLWLSGAGGTWRRANSLRVDTPTGLAPFTPARLIDTRSNIGTAGSSPGLGANQPLQPGVTYTFGPFTNRNGLPADAVGVLGNLTAVGYTGAGYATIFPAGVAAPVTSSVNFAPPFAGSGWANACTVGFGTGANAGKISIRLSNNGITSHVILDVTAYLQ